MLLQNDITHKMIEETDKEYCKEEMKWWNKKWRVSIWKKNSKQKKLRQTEGSYKINNRAYTELKIKMESRRNK